MSIKELWEEAMELARKEYEEEVGNWEDADKYEREDRVFSKYMELQAKNGG